MKSRSLRLQLLAWVVLPLAGLVMVNLWTSYDAAHRTADIVTDRTLLASARTIAEQVAVRGDVLDATVPPAALEMFDTGEGDKVYYRVETAQAKLVTGYPDLPMPPAGNSRGYPATYRDATVRLVAFPHPIVGAGAASPIVVVVGVTMRGHDAMVNRLWLGAAEQQVVLVLIAGILVLIGLHRGLAPLLKLRDAVLSRDRPDLEPLSVPEAQGELRPLIDALNAYMDRVRQQMAAQRRFVANAAHQLRTPLALLSTQAAYALRETRPDARSEALAALQVSTRRLARLADQLLTLSRAEPGSRRPRSDRVDLADAARQVLELYAPIAVERLIDLGLEEDGTPVVQGDAVMLREMIVNLVDNALRYTPSGGRVTVRASGASQTVRLTVCDNGPGILPSERDRVFERFYRMPGSADDGSGLGLAIVREIVEGARGKVTLSDAPAGGLVVEVELPAAA